MLAAMQPFEWCWRGYPNRLQDPHNPSPVPLAPFPDMRGITEAPPPGEENDPWRVAMAREFETLMAFPPAKAPPPVLGVPVRPRGLRV